MPLLNDIGKHFVFSFLLCYVKPYFDISNTTMLSYHHISSILMEKLLWILQILCILKLFSVCHIITGFCQLIFNLNFFIMILQQLFCKLLLHYPVTGSYTHRAHWLLGNNETISIKQIPKDSLDQVQNIVSTSLSR